MKRTVLLGAAVLALSFVVSLGSGTVSAKAAQKAKDAQNGNWGEQKVILADTSEADLMVRIGDIDGMNTVDEDALLDYNPFKRKDSYSHSYPWEPEKKDVAGTDCIYLGSKASKNSSSCDGYASEFRYWQDSKKEFNIACKEGAMKLNLNYKKELKGINVKSAVLQICIDDFQPLAFGSKYSVKINGKKAEFIADIINKQEQTGPISRIITVNVPKSFLKAIKKGKLTITIDETTGIGDGYAVDFVKLLINPKSEMVGKAINLKSVTSNDGITRINYSEDKNATGYEIRYSLKKTMIDSTSIFVDYSDETTYDLYDLTPGKKYYLQVRSFVNQDGTRDFSEWSVIKEITAK